MLSLGALTTLAAPAHADAAVAAAGEPAANALVVLNSTGGGSSWELTTTDKVFHIGANKAGTTSMWLFYTDLPGDWNPCHDLCQPGDVSWADFSHKQIKDSPVLLRHRVFLDNGDTSDYKWLYEAFPHSRFVLNLRKLQDWLVSRYDMIREIRLAGGCSANGTDANCKSGYYKECAPEAIFNGKKCLKSKLTWTDNSAETMRKWVYGVAKTQSEQYKFFEESHERMNRFVMADFTDPSLTDGAIRRLAWINRKNLSSHQTNEFLDMYTQLPKDIPEAADLPGPHQIPHMLSDPHPKSTVNWISRNLKDWGCQYEADARIYEHCKKQIEHHADADELQMLDSLPPTRFPSSTWWRDHGYSTTSLPEGSEIIDATDEDEHKIVEANQVHRRLASSLARHRAHDHDDDGHGHGASR